MAKSLADQLLGAGLVSKKQVQQAHKAKKKQKKTKVKAGESLETEAAIAAKKAIEERAERDRALNAKLNEEAEAKAIKAQVIQLVKTNAITINNGEVKYYFKFDNKAKSIFVTEELQNHLMRGLATIVVLDDSTYVVPAVCAEKVSQRDAAIVVKIEQEEQSVDEDDPYKDFVIPDDLMW